MSTRPKKGKIMNNAYLTFISLFMLALITAFSPEKASAQEEGNAIPYPLPEWEIVQRKLEDLSNINPQARLLQRLLIGHATDLELDANGRILLPALLRDYAGLSKKLVLVGQGNKIEIWSEDQWKESMQGWLAKGATDLIKDGDAFTGLSV